MKKKLTLILGIIIGAIVIITSCSNEIIPTDSITLNKYEINFLYKGTTNLDD